MADRRFLARAARAYYLDDKPKTQIASELGVSRFKVARLLEQARAEGVVHISVLDGALRDDDLAEHLKEHLALDTAIVVAGDEDEEANRAALAQAAAAYIGRTVTPGSTFGLSWGRTLSAIGQFMETLPSSTAVALTGGVGTDFEQSPVEVLRRVAARSEVATMSIFAPLLVDSAATADGLRSTPAIASVLELYDRLDLAVVSVGSWAPPITQVLDSLTPAEKSAIDAADAAAEMVGIFLRSNGSPIDGTMRERRISISADQLIRVPNVLAVAGGLDKASALAAVARSRIITSLITDAPTALSLLDRPPVDAGPRVLPAP